MRALSWNYPSFFLIGPTFEIQVFLMAAHILQKKLGNLSALPVPNIFLKRLRGAAREFDALLEKLSNGRRIYGVTPLSTNFL